MMMSAIKSTLPKDWDFEWDYSMGDLENFGFAKGVWSGGVIKMTAEGLMLDASKGGGAQYRYPQEFTTDGITEVVVNFKSFYEQPIDTNGLNIRLSSSSTDGFKISAFLNQFIIPRPLNKTLLDASIDKDYIIRIEYQKGVHSRCYIDGVLLFDEPKFVTEFVRHNVIAQQAGGQTVVKSLKYKFYDKKGGVA